MVDELLGQNSGFSEGFRIGKCKPVGDELRCVEGLRCKPASCWTCGLDCVSRS